MIISPSTAAFVKAHADDDVRQLALKKVPEGVDLQLALTQIDGRQRARKKLPTLAATEGIIYPPHISMEQCSSEATAVYKANLARRLREEVIADGIPSRGNETVGLHRGNALVDLTGGFGIDFIYMSRGYSEATYVERQEHLCQAARENFFLLGMGNAKVVNGDATRYLEEMLPVDTIYLDPARRNDVGGRVYAIDDCTPNVLDMLPMLRRKARHIIIKLSPMFDWRKAVSDIGRGLSDLGDKVGDLGNKVSDLGNGVSEVHIVSAGGECKELLLVIGKTSLPHPKVNCANIGGTPELFVFDPSEILGGSSAKASMMGESGSSKAMAMGNAASLSIGQSGCLLVPNPSVMKSGLFTLLSERFSIPQVSPDSHYFLSTHDVEGFPGKSYRIAAISSMNKRELREKLSGIKRANIATRNFPMTPQELRKRLKLEDGGDTYIFGTTSRRGEHLVFICW